MLAEFDFVPAKEASEDRPFDGFVMIKVAMAVATLFSPLIYPASRLIINPNDSDDRNDDRDGDGYTSMNST